MAMLPSAVAGTELNNPWKLPMGVRVALTMTACLIAKRASFCVSVFLAKQRLAPSNSDQGSRKVYQISTQR
jgi:hypothetical protein